jgi:uncharacterized protein (DUF58 family)
VFTRRGLSVLVVALSAYLLGRVVGTYEFYVAALAFAALAAVSWIVTLVSGARLRVRLGVQPDNPIAGDPMEIDVEIENRSFLPTSALTVSAVLAPAAGEDLNLDVSPISPRGTFSTIHGVGAARRGVYALPAPRVHFTDPFGIARRRRRVGEEIEVLVLPRISVLRNCVFFGGHGLGRLGRLRPTLAHGASDFRGVRPHQPGEPLSRIDWKSTAKTGTLMLREVDEPARDEVTIILDGTASSAVGEPPDDTFEISVAAVGSIGEFVLREGLATALFMHGGGDEHLRFESGEAGRVHMLRALAAARVGASVPLADTLRRNEGLLGRGMAMVVVTPAYDRGLLIALTRLRERGLPVFLVHVDAVSFIPHEVASSPAVDPEGPLAVEIRRFLLLLAHSGVPSVTLRRGDLLEDVLSLDADGVGSSVLA